MTRCSGAYCFGFDFPDTYHCIGEEDHEGACWCYNEFGAYVIWNIPLKDRVICSNNASVIPPVLVSGIPTNPRYVMPGRRKACREY